MNERIKQLAEQCESFGSWDNKTYSFDKEKFAELIVRECANIAREWSDDYVVEDTAPKQVDMFIKQHFGVEL
jgi:hypothetical protein